MCILFPKVRVPPESEDNLPTAVYDEDGVYGGHGQTVGRGVKAPRSPGEGGGTAASSGRSPTTL